MKQKINIENNNNFAINIRKALVVVVFSIACVLTPTFCENTTSLHSGLDFAELSAKSFAPIYGEKKDEYTFESVLPDKESLKTKSFVLTNARIGTLSKDANDKKYFSLDASSEPSTVGVQIYEDYTEYKKNKVDLSKFAKQKRIPNLKVKYATIATADPDKTEFENLSSADDVCVLGVNKESKQLQIAKLDGFTNSNARKNDNTSLDDVTFKISKLNATDLPVSKETVISEGKVFAKHIAHGGLANNLAKLLKVDPNSVQLSAFAQGDFIESVKTEFLELRTMTKGDMDEIIKTHNGANKRSGAIGGILVNGHVDLNTIYKHTTNDTGAAASQVKKFANGLLLRGYKCKHTIKISNAAKVALGITVDEFTCNEDQTLQFINNSGDQGNIDRAHWVAQLDNLINGFGYQLASKGLLNALSGRGDGAGILGSPSWKKMIEESKKLQFFGSDKLVGIPLRDVVDAEGDAQENASIANLLAHYVLANHANVQLNDGQSYNNWRTELANGLNLDWNDDAQKKLINDYAANQVSKLSVKDYFLANGHMHSSDSKNILGLNRVYRHNIADAVRFTAVHSGGTPPADINADSGKGMAPLVQFINKQIITAINGLTDQKLQMKAKFFDKSTSIVPSIRNVINAQSAANIINAIKAMNEYVLENRSIDELDLDKSNIKIRDFEQLPQVLINAITHKSDNGIGELFRNLTIFGKGDANSNFDSTFATLLGKRNDTTGIANGYIFKAVDQNAFEQKPNALPQGVTKKNDELVASLSGIVLQGKLSDLISGTNQKIGSVAMKLTDAYKNCKAHAELALSKLVDFKFNTSDIKEEVWKKQVFKTDDISVPDDIAQMWSSQEIIDRLSAANREELLELTKDEKTKLRAEAQKRKAGATPKDNKDKKGDDEKLSFNQKLLITGGAVATIGVGAYFAGLGEYLFPE